eukprot:TRINITY_DN96097_c0_g1_i1.p1 TRINITY_DN96097_c0_g1~~TRINITY_DN96097_c0_g1_i1.p1  ORF type:complete len:204 (+),score=50.53 TRINITY_DN96097_c0_g1_i1:130-741(+)
MRLLSTALLLLVLVPFAVYAVRDSAEDELDFDEDEWQLQLAVNGSDSNAAVSPASASAPEHTSESQQTNATVTTTGSGNKEVAADAEAEETNTDDAQPVSDKQEEEVLDYSKISAKKTFKEAERSFGKLDAAIEVLGQAHGDAKTKAQDVHKKLAAYKDDINSASKVLDQLDISAVKLSNEITGYYEKQEASKRSPLTEDISP